MSKPIVVQNGEKFNGEKEKKPTTLPPVFDSIPQALKDRKNWIGWKWEYNPKLSKPWTKPPYTLRANQIVKASSTNPDDWRKFLTILHYFNSYDFDGVGIILTDDLIGIDLDNCRNPDTGELTPLAQLIVRTINSYTEVSPSGTGVKILCRGANPGTRNRNNELGIEIYHRDSPRYFTITGQHLEGTPETIEERSAAVADVYRWYLLPLEQEDKSNQAPTVETGSLADVDVAEIVEIASAAANGEKFRKLWAGEWVGNYKSQSDADLALCSFLAFYCANDPELIDRCFRASGLMRPKWERRENYRKSTITKAYKEETYKWKFSPDLEGAFNAGKIEGEKVSEKTAEEKPPTTPVVSSVELVKQDTVDALAADVARIEEKKAQPIKFRRWSQLKAIAATQKEDWLWTGWGEFGTLCLLTGLPFSGKSCIIAELIGAIVNGREFCGIPTVKAPILLMDLENKERILVKRVERALAGDEGDIEKLLFSVDPDEMPSPVTPAYIEKCLADMQTMGTFQRSVIIIDTMRSAFAGAAANEMDPGDMVKLLVPIKRLAMKMNSLVIVLHHNAKYSNAYSGSTAIAAVADYMWNWTVDKKAFRGTLSMEGRAEIQEELEFCYDRRFQRNIYIGTRSEIKDAEREEKTDKTLSAVLKVMTNTPNSAIKTNELEELTGLKRTVLQRALTVALNESYVIRLGTGKPYSPYAYYRTPKGSDFIMQAELGGAV